MKNLLLISMLFVFMACKTINVINPTQEEIKVEQLIELTEKHNITEIAIYEAGQDGEWDPINYLYHHTLKVDEAVIHITNIDAHMHYTYDLNKIVKCNRFGKALSIYLMR